MAAASARRCLTCAFRATCTIGMPATARRELLLSAASPPETSIFKRPLPQELVQFSSKKGRALFAQSMMSGEMEPFFPLAEQFVTQEEPTYCALGSLTMVMNALGVDPQRRWKDATGPGWRWWADEMFAPSGSCLPSLESVRRDGVSLDSFTQIAAASGASVELHRPAPVGVGTEDSFRDSLAAAAATPDSFAVVNFCRATLGQTGSGHFSPVGGYHRGSDSVLVLDVARFKYPPCAARARTHACIWLRID